MSHRLLSAGGAAGRILCALRQRGFPPGICPIYNGRLLSGNPATVRAYSVQTWASICFVRSVPWGVTCF